MTNGQLKTRNCSIDIFRYICAIMVVSIHTHPFADVSTELGYIFYQVLPRIGVPFFFAVSGYFYTQNLEKGKSSYFSYLKKLLSTYFVWSCIYYIIDFIQWGHLNIKGYIINCISQFFIHGSHYHFWFFPALIFSVSLTTVLYRVRCKKILVPLSIILYVIGCLGCSYYEIGVKIPFLGQLFTSDQFDLIRRIVLMGFPLFICGYLVNKVKEKILNKLTNKKLLVLCLSAVFAYIVEILAVHVFKWQRTLVTTLSLYLLVIVTMIALIKNPLFQYKSLSNKCRVLANFTYYSHPLFIMLLTFLAENVLRISITETPMFLLTVFFTWVVAMVVYKLDNKFLNSIVS